MISLSASLKIFQCLDFFLSKHMYNFEGLIKSNVRNMNLLNKIKDQIYFQHRVEFKESCWVPEQSYHVY